MIFNNDGEREEDEGTTCVVELMIEGLVGLIIERLTREHV